MPGCDIMPLTVTPNTLNELLKSVATKLSESGHRDPELEQLIETLNTAFIKVPDDLRDLPHIARHLTHISQTAENGVMKVINLAESMMEQTLDVRDKLEQVAAGLDPAGKAAAEMREIESTLDIFQNNCFSVITAVEFEDINRQLMERILHRISHIEENLAQISGAMRLSSPGEASESQFLENLKHIIDLDGARRQSQDEVDELFESF